MHTWCRFLKGLLRSMTGYDKLNTCGRCGTCCRKGGPSLHHADADLVQNGIIPANTLFTIRKGEPALDNIRGIIQPAVGDIIKIANQPLTTACVFLEAGTVATCELYANRPLECRLLKCWDTTEIESAYCRDRLARKDLLSGIDGLWDLIILHQEKCAYSRVARYMNEINKRSGAMSDILEMIRYDAHVRTRITAKMNSSAEMAPFLLGRPLTETIRMYGFQVIRQGDELGLRPYTLSTKWSISIDATQDDTCL